MTEKRMKHFRTGLNALSANTANYPTHRRSLANFSKANTTKENMKLNWNVLRG